MPGATNSVTNPPINTSRTLGLPYQQLAIGHVGVEPNPLTSRQEGSEQATEATCCLGPQLSEVPGSCLRCPGLTWVSRTKGKY
jgi:hypothetical protein